MKRIPLTRGKFAIVDDEDFEWLSKKSWYAFFNGWIFYAATNKSIKIDKTRKTFLMHRIILNPLAEMQIDHKNGNGLDNRRNNLRICIQEENNRNKIGKSHSSIYKGVTWDKNRNCWKAAISKQNKIINLGRFKDEKEAAFAYNFMAVKLGGEFAYLNEI